MNRAAEIPATIVGLMNAPAIDKPGSIQFIVSPDDEDSVLGMIFRCPSGSGEVHIVSFEDEVGVGDDHRTTWDFNRRFPTVHGRIRTHAWTGYLTLGTWTPDRKGS